MKMNIKWIKFVLKVITVIPAVYELWKKTKNFDE